MDDDQPAQPNGNRGRAPCFDRWHRQSGGGDAEMAAFEVSGHQWRRTVASCLRIGGDILAGQIRREQHCLEFKRIFSIAIAHGQDAFILGDLIQERLDFAFSLATFS